MEVQLGSGLGTMVRMRATKQSELSSLSWSVRVYVSKH